MRHAPSYCQPSLLGTSAKLASTATTWHTAADSATWLRMSALHLQHARHLSTAAVSSCVAPDLAHFAVLPDSTTHTTATRCQGHNPNPSPITEREATFTQRNSQTQIKPGSRKVHAHVIQRTPPSLVHTQARPDTNTVPDGFVPTPPAANTHGCQQQMPCERQHTAVYICQPSDPVSRLLRRRPPCQTQTNLATTWHQECCCLWTLESGPNPTLSTEVGCESTCVSQQKMDQHGLSLNLVTQTSHCVAKCGKPAAVAGNKCGRSPPPPPPSGHVRGIKS